MRPMLMRLIIAGSCLAALAAESKAGESMLDKRERIELPPYAERVERSPIHLYASASEYEAALADTRFVFERLWYESDGLSVAALLYRPVNNRGALPTVVFNRGSHVRNDVAPEYLVTFRRFAEAGYVVLAPMLRGSEGAAGQDELGGDDLNDLLGIAELADELANVDRDNLFLLGESRGGMMVLQAIREDFPARAAAIYGAPTDFFALLRNYPERYQPLAEQLWPAWQTDDGIFDRRSAVRWADQLDTPLLILHGGDDQSMPVSQSLSLASRLEAHGKPYALRVFAYENHAISGRATERDTLAIEWFDRHIPDPERPSGANRGR